MQARIDRLTRENEQLRSQYYIVPRDWLEG
jgi:hypothetical protein